MNDIVRYSLASGVATVQMDDGKVNCLSPAMLQAINAALDRAETDGAVVVLTGRAGKFSAGFDLATLQAGGSAAEGMLIGGFKLAVRLLQNPNPVVAACNGHALAMGSFLLLGADYRIGTAGNFKIGANEVAIGMTLPHFAVELCRHRLASAHFLRATTTAEIYDPVGAVAAGFLDEVVAADALATRAADAAARLAALNIEAYRATKARTMAVANTALTAAIAADQDLLRAGSPL